MKTTIKTVFLAAGLVALAAPVAAQSTKRATPKPTERVAIQPRKKHQQNHIAHRVQSRNLTAGEAASLGRKNAGLNAEDRDKRERKRGRITSTNHTQLQISKATGHRTHNTAAAKNVNHQHHAAKLKTSQLTTHQAAHLETKEASLHHQTHGDRERRGKPTPKGEDQAQTNEQNSNTDQIHLKKHNARMF
jgi:hypothetical protein